MRSVEDLHSLSDAAIDSRSEELLNLSHKIWNNPELAYKERYAHEVLTDFLDSNGFQVTRHYSLETGFRAEFGSTSGPTVAVLCEYDALPVVDHGCGHNLIAEAGVAAGLGIKGAMEKSKIGKVVVMGTPAEEGGGGKVDMIRAGCFKDIDFCLMVHPAPFNVAFYKSQSMAEVIATYHGTASHAAAFPWKGVNALDAAVMAYNGISVLRQQMKPTWSIHGIFTEAGTKPNVIPHRAQLHFFVRTTTNEDGVTLKGKVQNVFEAAAQSTGCSVDIKWPPNAFASMETNSCLASLYQKHAMNMGETFMSKEKQEAILDGSTDMGNVTLEVPGIQPLYCIAEGVPYHSHDFRIASGTMVAHKKTLTAAKAMARTALEVISDAKILEDAREEFKCMSVN